MSIGAREATPTVASAQGHVPELDGIRGVAILLVACHNMQLLDRAPLHGIAAVFHHFVDMGWVGVTLFFVLSGHLITGILLDASPKSTSRISLFKRFFIRRALRIFPLYYGLLLVVFWLLPMLDMQPAKYAQESPNQIWYWLFLSNWAAPLGYVQDALPHLWSLGVEEQFYLLLPWLVMSCPRPRTMFWLALGLAIACIAMRCGFWALVHEPETEYHWTIFRMDALALGACTAALQRDVGLREWFKRHDKHFAWTMLVLLIGGALLTRGFPRSTMLGQTVGYTIHGLVFAYLVHAAVSRQPTTPDMQGANQVFWMRVLRSAWLRRAGLYSYGFYIIHKPLHDAFSSPVYESIVRHVEQPFAAALLHLICMAALVFVLAAAVHRLVERPMLSLKDRWAA